MSNITPRYNRMALMAILLTGTFARTLYAETTVLHEDFSNAVSNAATLSIDSVVSWHGFHNRAGEIPNIEEVSDGHTGKVLNFAGKSQSAFVVASFSLVTLQKAGDYIDLQVSYRYVHAPTNPVRGFVMGLYNSHGMPITAGNLDAKYPGVPDVGIEQPGIRVGKAANAQTEDVVLDKAMGISTDFPSEILKTGDSGIVATAKKVYVLSLKITREIDQTFSLEFGFDGEKSKVSLKADDMLSTAFDTVLISPLGRGFGENEGNNYIQVLDVSIATHEK